MRYIYIYTVAILAPDTSEFEALRPQCANMGSPMRVRKHATKQGRDRLRVMLDGHPTDHPPASETYSTVSELRTPKSGSLGAPTPTHSPAATQPEPLTTSTPPPDRLTYVRSELHKLRYKTKSVIAARMVQEGLDGHYGTKQEMFGRLAMGMLADSRGEPQSLPREAGAGYPLPGQRGALNWLTYDPGSQSYFYIADILGGLRLSFRDLTAAKRILERVGYVKSEIKQLRRKTKPVIAARLIQEGLPDDPGCPKPTMLYVLAVVLLSTPRPDEEGAGDPLPSEPSWRAWEMPFSVAWPPAPTPHVHYSLHMGEFIIERFKQYSAPFTASGGERMGWILGKAETLYKLPILQAWGLFIPRDAWQSIGTDGWQTSEDR